MADQHEPGLARAGELAGRFLVERGIEMGNGLRDGCDFVHPFEIGSPGESVDLAADDGDRERPAESFLDRRRGADHFEGDVAHRSVEMLGDDEDPAHQPSPRFSRMIPAMAPATAAASPSIIAARPVFGGS